MQIASPEFQNQATIPQKYTCQGEGVNPPLAITDVPQDAKSLALIVDDPDAVGGLFTHWLIWHIDPMTKMIDEDSIPDGAMEGINGAGEIGWIAPCPPKDTGLHHYRFQLFALDSEDLALEEGAGRDEVEQAIKTHDIGRAELIGMYTTDTNPPKNPTELP